MTVLRDPENWPMWLMVARDLDVHAFDHVFALTLRDYGPEKEAWARGVLARSDRLQAMSEIHEYASQVGWYLKTLRGALGAAIARGDLSEFGAGLAWRRDSCERMNTTTALAVDCAWAVHNDPAIAAWVEKALGLGARADAAIWRGLGVGVARATLHRDGTWQPFADADVPASLAGKGVPVITIPVVPGGGSLAAPGAEAIEIFAVELAPNATRRATGRVFALTGLAAGLGIDSATFEEWREWSTGLAVVATPLDWVRAHRAVRVAGARDDADAHRAFVEKPLDHDGRPVGLSRLESAQAREAAGGEAVGPDDLPAPDQPAVIVAPFVGDPDGDGLPAVWLADLDPDQATGAPDEFREGEIDRLLLESDPLVGADRATAKALARRVDAARRRRFPPKPAIEIYAPEPVRAESAKGEAA